MSDVMIPILKNTKDPHYRYKMPKLTAKVEGSGNGIKTVVSNMSQVAKSIGRPPSYPIKYFGCELGAQVTTNNDLFIVNGCHDPEKLQNLLYGFIKKFVLCTKCNNPETNLTIVNNKIQQKCIACGHDTVIPKAIHKITTFIINHPPEGGVVTSSSKRDKASKADKRSKKHANSSSPTNEKELIDTEEQFLKQQNDSDQFDDDELTTDAYSERMRTLCDGLNNGNILRDAKESANIFFKFVKEKKDAGLITDQQVQKEIVKEAERLDIKDKSVLVLSELLFTENIMEEIKTNKILFLRFCHENKKAQKYLLGGFEKLVGDVYHDKLFVNAMRILKQFYDEDVLDEEVLIEWSAKESKKYVSKEMSRKIHEKVAPFIKWLKEAEVEEESSSEDGDDMASKSTNSKTPSLDIEDDDDDFELDFSHRAKGIEEAAPAVERINPVLANGQKVEDNLDDVDIDDIWKEILSYLKKDFLCFCFFFSMN